LISQTREYVVNLPTARLVEKVDRCGMVSGRDVDKFATVGLTPLPASQVKPPLIAECPINVECRLRDVIEMGDHDTFVGEVVAVHADQELLDEEGRVCMDRLDAFAFMFCYGSRGEYWSLDKKIGDFGFTRQR
jgi:flavin reductase (DIM6/NTAB) family NADH-FMN oxidoreductase RutF